MEKLPNTANRPARERAEAPGHKSSFLDLPAELRNLVYEYVIEDLLLHLAYLEEHNPIYNPSPLLYVNKQISCGYKSLAVPTATMQKRVLSFNFAHVATYLDQLSDKEIARLPGDDEKLPTQTFRIELSGSYIPCAWVGIMPWLRRMGDVDRT